MGSSKKHKERDREHKRKHRHRSRSRSRSRERKRHKRDRDRDKRKEDEIYEYLEAPVDSEYGKDIDYNARNVPVVDYKHGSAGGQEIELADNEMPKPTSASGDLSLSIEATNRIRAKLGLKPLEVNSAPDGNDDSQTTVDGDVHVPAINLAEKKRTEQLQEKLERAKEKRNLSSKLEKVKTLGESDSDEEDTAAWVRKNRRIQKERAMAEKRAKMLEEMDEEFGIGNLVEEEFHNKKKDYTSKDLRGLKVEHELSSFNEGRNYILTLQDRGILDEDINDTLVNVNIIDDERAKVNVENKKKKPDYNPYDNAEVDEYGMFKMKNVLEKYDEEIEGEKKTSFELGSGGKYDTAPERRMEEIRAQLQQQSQMLTMPSLQVASEYYTTEEMDAKFKKVKKKSRKIRKKGKVTADDLMPLPDQDVENSDFGSRSRGRGMYRDPNEEEDYPLPNATTYEYNHGQTFEYNHGEIDNQDQDDDMDIDNDLEESEILGPDEDLTGVPVEDEAGIELHTALAKARKMKHKKDKSVVNKVAKTILSNKTTEENEDVKEKNKGLNIVLNSTSEFCRALGDIPTYGQSGNRDEEKDELMDFERELMEERRKREEEEEQMSGWNRVEIDETPVDITNEEKAVLDDEPVVNQGVGAALELAKKKGYIENTDNSKKGAVSKNKDLQAQHYSIEDKRYDDLDEKYRKRSDRYSSGIITDFKEKEGYRPDVKLEYVDESGRMLNQKEAFRQLSHRFHGKGSGKKKTEKRHKKLEEEQLMKMMSSTDTPLNTLNLLKDKQKAEKSPFVILTGNKGLATNSIVKPN